MPATIYYDKDADLAALQGKTVAIIGYGSQGHAHSQNLRDSGVPVELQGDLYEKEIKPNLKTGNILMCSHGFNVHFGFVKAPEGVDTLLVAPKGPGHLVRSEFVAGGGVPCLIATNDGARPETFKIGLAYAKGIGGTRGG